jgi:hypothetical protein
MAEPGNELAAEAGGQGRLRASRADREQLIDVLKTAFAQGRLDRDEFDLRVGRALTSRTYADLAALTAGIPDRPARPWPPGPARESVSKKAVVATTCATAAFIGVWPVMLLAPPPRSPFALSVVVVWFVLAMVVPTGWLALLQDWLRKRGEAARAGAVARRRWSGIPAPGTGRPGQAGPAK